MVGKGVAGKLEGNGSSLSPRNVNDWRLSPSRMIWGWEAGESSSGVSSFSASFVELAERLRLISGMPSEPGSNWWRSGIHAKKSGPA